MHTCSRLSIEASFLGELIDRPTIVAGKALDAYCKRVRSNRLSSLLKNLEIGASPVFLPWGLGRSGCCEQTLTYAASSLGMRIRL